MKFGDHSVWLGDTIVWRWDDGREERGVALATGPSGDILLVETFFPRQLCGVKPEAIVSVERGGGDMMDCDEVEEWLRR